MDSAPGADVCDLAAVGYFLDPANEFAATVCPENADCRGGLEMPRPKLNFWVDRSKAIYASSIYSCSRSSCIGATIDDDDNNDGSGVRRRLAAAPEVQNCWTIDAYNASSKSAMQAAEEGGPCYEDTLQCTEGSTGPLCGSCLDGYTFNSALSQCVLCESASNLNPIIIMSSIGFSGLVAAVLRWRGFNLQKYVRLPSFPFLKHADKGTLKVLWSTTQIISSVQWNLSVRFPYPFSDFLGIMSFLQFDFLTLDCMSGESSFYNKLYVTQFTPLFLFAMIVLVGVLRALAAELGAKRMNAKASGAIFNQHMYMALLLSYCVFPTVSALQLKSLWCMTLEHDGKVVDSFLREDSSISCLSPSYQRFKAVVILGIVVYQSSKPMSTPTQNMQLLIPPNTPLASLVPQFQSSGSCCCGAFAMN